MLINVLLGDNTSECPLNQNNQQPFGFLVLCYPLAQ